MNSNKKAIYLKNQVLKTLQETLKSPEKEELLEKNKITIENFLKELKEINEQDFNEIKEMISYFLANISSTQKENKELKLFFLKLLLHIFFIPFDRLLNTFGEIIFRIISETRSRL